MVAADGNILGFPFTIPLELAGLPPATRDGRLRAAISSLIAIAKDHAAQAVVAVDPAYTSRWGAHHRSGPPAERYSVTRNGRLATRRASGQ